MKRFFLIYCLCIAIATACSATPARAQYSDLPAIGNGAISLELSTLFPRPQQAINAKVLSFSTDLNRATITWLLNGQTVASGRGLTTYSFNAGSFNSPQTLTVRAVTPEGVTYEQSQRLSPGEVDIIWQAESYVPPFYKGKALYPYQGKVTVAAIPHFSDTGINPKNFIYKWKVNGVAFDNVSGYGKDSIEVTGTVIAKPIDVTVTVTNLDGTVSAYKQVTINGQTPEIAYYEDSQLYGPLFNRALADFELKNKEIRLKAAPFFFSVDEPHTAPSVTYSWRINNSTVATQNNGTNSLVLRRPDGASGRSTIGLKVTNNIQILQFADSKSTIYFSSEQN